MTPSPREPIACDLRALDPRQLERYRALRSRMDAERVAFAELPDGFAFRYPATDSWLASLAEFITLERRCCPFLTFALEVAPERGTTDLRLTGDDRVKAFLAAQLRS